MTLASITLARITRHGPGADALLLQKPRDMGNQPVALRQALITQWRRRRIKRGGKGHAIIGNDNIARGAKLHGGGHLMIVAMFAKGKAARHNDQRLAQSPRGQHRADAGMADNYPRLLESGIKSGRGHEGMHIHVRAGPLRIGGLEQDRLVTRLRNFP